jgi:ABC-type sugar transport system, periplasmic component
MNRHVWSAGRATIRVAALLTIGALVASACAGATATPTPTSAGPSTPAATATAANLPVYKIALSMTYFGNDWQTESMNGFVAESKTPPYDTRTQVQVFQAGTDVQTHIQQLRQMIDSGFNAIVTFPANPTAIEPVLQEACAKGVLVIAYGSELPLTCPTLYYINSNDTLAGQVTAQWLADKLGGKGNIVMATGVPGTSADTERNAAAEAVFAKYPDIKILAKFSTMWDEATAQKGMAQLLATYSTQINGVWGQVGLGLINAYQAAGLPLVPITGESENGYRLDIIDPALRAKGLDGISYGNPQFTAAYGLKVAVAVLDGTKIPQKMLIPTPLNTADQLVVCDDTGNPPAGKTYCNVLPATVAPSGGWYPTYREDTLAPELCLDAAINGNACPGQTAKPPLNVDEWNALPKDAESRA